MYKCPKVNKNVKFSARQKSYGFKILAKLGRWQKIFKITAGTYVLKKSCSTSKSTWVIAVLLSNFLQSGLKWRLCNLASLRSQIKSRKLKPSQAKWSQPTIQPTKQTKQLTNQPTNRATNQPTNQRTNEPTNQPNQPTNQPLTNQPTNQRSK